MKKDEETNSKSDYYSCRLVRRFRFSNDSIYSSFTSNCACRTKKAVIFCIYFNGSVFFPTLNLSVKRILKLKEEEKTSYRK